MPSPEDLPDGKDFAEGIDRFLKNGGSLKNLPVSMIDFSSGRVSIRDAWEASGVNKAQLIVFAIEVGSIALLMAGGVGYLAGEAASLKALSDAAKPIVLTGAAGLGVFAMGYAGLSAACLLD